MDIIKLILAAVGLLAVIVIGYWLIGVIFSLFWLFVYLGIIGLVGYGGYKLFFGPDPKEKALEDKMPISIAEMQGSERALEEYRRKYLPK
jgi:hypothetical protein